MKTIKEILTTEQAKQLYAKDPTFRETILHEFTDAELGIEPKAFTWYDLVTNEGWWINSRGEIIYVTCTNKNYTKSIYPCKQDVEQALAKCMVLQLARHYNGCEQHEIVECFKPFWDIDTNTISIFRSMGNINEIVKFLREKDLEKCIKDNEELFKTMLGVSL